MDRIILQDIYRNKYGVGEMAIGDLMRAMQNDLSIGKHKEFYEMALVMYTISAIEQILNEGNSLSNIDLELPFSSMGTQN